MNDRDVSDDSYDYSDHSSDDSNTHGLSNGDILEQEGFIDDEDSSQPIREQGTQDQFHVVCRIIGMPVSLHIDVKSSDTPLEFKTRIARELAASGPDSANFNVDNYCVMVPHLSRQMKMQSQSIEANQITPANFEVVLMPTKMRLNIIAPNMIVYNCEIDGSRTVLDILTNFTNTLKLQNAAELCLMEPPEDSDFGNIQVKDNISSTELATFNLPEVEVIEQLSFKLPRHVRDSQDKIDTYLINQRLTLLLSPLEQGISDGSFLYLRFHSFILPSRTPTTVSNRNNLIAYQIYSDFISGIYNPEVFPSYFLAGTFASIKAAGLQNIGRIINFDNENGFKNKSLENFSKVVDILSKYGGVKTNQTKSFAISGKVFDFVQISEDENGKRKISKDKINNKKKKNKNEIGSSLEFFNSNCQLVLYNNGNQTTMHGREVSLNFVEESRFTKVKQAVVKISDSRISFTFVPNTEEDLNLFLAHVKIGSISYSSDLHSADLVTAKSIAREEIAYILHKGAADNASDTQNNKSATIRSKDISIKNYLRPDFQKNEKDEVKQSKIFKYYSKIAPITSNLDELVSNLIASVSYFGGYLCYRFVSDAKLSANTLGRTIKTSTKDGKPESTLPIFSVIFHPDHIQLIYAGEFVKGAKRSAIPSYIAIDYSDLRQWVLQSTNGVKVLVQARKNHSSLTTVMNLCGIDPANKGDRTYYLQLALGAGINCYTAHEMITLGLNLAKRDSYKESGDEVLKNNLQKGLYKQNMRSANLGDAVASSRKTVR